MPINPAPEWFAAALDALHDGDVDGFLAIYADDAVHEFPFAPEGRPQRLEGKAAIAEYMRRLPSAVRFDSLELLGLRETADELIVEAVADGTRIDIQQPFHMRYVWFITHANGRVSNFRDYMNPLLLRAG